MSHMKIFNNITVFVQIYTPPPSFQEFLLFEKETVSAEINQSKRLISKHP